MTRDKKRSQERMQGKTVLDNVINVSGNFLWRMGNEINLLDEIKFPIDASYLIDAAREEAEKRADRCVISFG